MILILKDSFPIRKSSGNQTNAGVGQDCSKRIILSEVHRQCDTKEARKRGVQKDFGLKDS